MIAILVARELTISFRQGGLYLLIVAQTLIILALTRIGDRVAQLATPWTPPSLGSTATTPQAGILGALASSLDTALFVGGAVWLVLFSLVAVPALAGPSVARDRERGTLSAVLGTGATPLTIVGAKLLGVLLQVALLLLTALPALGLAFVFGSPDPRLILEGCVLLAAWCVVIAALGILCSALSRRSVDGAATAFAAAVSLFAATLVAPLVAALAGVEVPSYAYQSNPLVAILALQPDLGRQLLELVPNNPWLPAVASQTSPLGPSWLPFVAGSALLGAVLALLTSVAVARLPTRT